MTGRRERLFLALTPGEPARAALAAVQREHLPAGSGRFVPGANLHLTLVFLGSVGPATRARLEAACAGVAFAPFTLRLERLGCWARAGVAWSAPQRAPAALPVLVEALRGAAHACDIAVEAREFRAHVTLARGIPAGSPLAAGPALAHPPVDWPVTQFALVRSTTRPDGPEYRVVATFSARGGPSGDGSAGPRGSTRGAGGGATVE